MINKIINVIGRFILGLVVLFLAIIIGMIFSIIGTLAIMALSNERTLNLVIIIIIGLVLIYNIGHVFERFLKRR